MTTQITDLHPKELWSYFQQITQIARTSGQEKHIQRFVEDFALSLGLETYRDSVNNIIVKKPATKGMENKQGIILQAHLDIIPQPRNHLVYNRHSASSQQCNYLPNHCDAYTTAYKNDENYKHHTIDEAQMATYSNEHYPYTNANTQTNTGINAYIDGEWVTAEDAILGSDNGIGVAAILSLLASTDIAHGNIEALFTSSAQSGMIGAFGLKANVLQGDILLNLDAKTNGKLFVGCAGGIEAFCNLPIERQACPEHYHTYKINVCSLKGGHSGMNIIHQRANANKLLIRWLGSINYFLPTSDPTYQTVQMLGLNGGNVCNAIPNQAELTFATSRIDKVIVHSKKFFQKIREEYAGIEDNIQYTIEPVPIQNARCLTKAKQIQVVALLNASPDGVYRMSTGNKNLVESSSNLSIIRTTEEHIDAQFLIRSASKSVKNHIRAKFCGLYGLVGTKVIYAGDYEGWTSEPDSEIVKTMQQTGTSIFGFTPNTQGTHCGLECAIIANTYPHLDMVSIGPTIQNAHSPNERVNIVSVDRFYRWLLATLEAAPEKHKKTLDRLVEYH